MNLLLRRFGFVWFEKTDRINGFWFALFEFGLVCLIECGLVWFAYSTDKQTNLIIFILIKFNL